jgi:hypothetical protein
MESFQPQKRKFMACIWYAKLKYGIKLILKATAPEQTEKNPINLKFR